MIEGGMMLEYGHAARGFVENYGWDDVVGEFEGILEEVVYMYKYPISIQIYCSFHFDSLFANKRVLQ